VSLGRDIAAYVDAQLPGPQILLGTIVVANGRQVLIADIADQPVACDWSPTFDDEMTAGGASLVGRKVEVHMVRKQGTATTQPVVAYTIIIGEKA
jgi:hypothetical protein